MSKEIGIFIDARDIAELENKLDLPEDVRDIGQFFNHIFIFLSKRILGEPVLEPIFGRDKRLEEYKKTMRDYLSYLEEKTTEELEEKLTLNPNHSFLPLEGEALSYYKKMLELFNDKE